MQRPTNLQTQVEGIAVFVVTELNLIAFSWEGPTDKPKAILPGLKG
jgi:hypothetical protein